MTLIYELDLDILQPKMKFLGQGLQKFEPEAQTIETDRMHLRTVINVYQSRLCSEPTLC